MGRKEEVGFTYLQRVPISAKSEKGNVYSFAGKKIKITQSLIIDYESHSVCFIFLIFFFEIIEGSNNRTSESWAGRRLEYWKLTRVRAGKSEDNNNRKQRTKALEC